MAKVRPAQSDNHNALLDTLYRDYWTEVCRFIQKRFGAGPPEPEEIAQATFERLAHMKTIGDIENPRGFLFTVAANIARDQHRRAVVRERAHLDIAHRDHELGVSDLTPENVLESRESLEAFKVALVRMPTIRRRVFLLVRIEGLSVTEVARQFGMSEGTVYKHVSRAMHDCLVALDGLNHSGKTRG